MPNLRAAGHGCRLARPWSLGVLGVGRTRASGLIAHLHDLGLVDRKEIGRTTMVVLARDNAAGELLDRLAHLRSVVMDRLRLLATEIEPAPLALVVFGSFARGEASTDSDIDVLAIRPDAADSETWTDAISAFATTARAKTGKAFWEALRRDSMGQRAGGEHTEVLDLLTQAGTDGRQAARQVAQLLR